MLKRLISVPAILLLLLTAITVNKAEAQCTTANVNWDNLDFLERNSAGYSTYITAGMFNNMVQTQRFGIGTNRVTIGTTFTTANIIGENTTHTGETGSNGTGADVEFNGTGTITMTFDTAISSVLFSLYDIDNNQSVTVTAFEGATPRAVTLTRPAGGNLVIAGNVATAPGSSQNNSSSVATLNVSVAGPVTSIVVVMGGTGGNFWLSDIQGCVYRSFRNNWYTISQPFTGQPAYVLAVHDLNTVYMVDSTGRAVALFQDTDPRVREINDLAYDPYKRIVYYSADGLERCTPAGSPDSIRHIKKYDFNTETITKIIDNVNNSPLYIPSFSYGLESGSAAFYDGDLYLGIEGTQSGSVSTGREGIVWRIEFAADSSTITQACQVFAQPVDNGTSLLHDWGDVVLKDGILYDFNAAQASSAGNYNIYNLQTQQITATYAGVSTTDKPRQAAQQWNGTLRWLHTDIALYNGTNVLTNRAAIVAAPRSATWVAGAGDAAEAFKPKADFGDAPASYDPVALSPALNERDTALRIGATYDWEWSKNTSTDASGDGGDEDGLAFVPIYDPSLGGYGAIVSVYNHTGGNAYVSAWLDYNNNGVFDASEGLAPITVASSTSMQNVTLSWTGISTTIPNGSYTFLRIRITSNNSLSTAKATGYFFDGETEDYRVLVDDFPASVNLISFSAKAMNSTTVRLNWTSVNEQDLSGYGIERSTDGINWVTIGFVNAKANGSASNADYTFNDLQAAKGKSYYRLKLTDINATFSYSEIRNVTIKDLAALVSITPNPAQTNATLYITSDMNADVLIMFNDMQGRKVRTEKHRLLSGGNTISLDNLDRLPDGTYIVQMVMGQEVINKKLVIGKSRY